MRRPDVPAEPPAEERMRLFDDALRRWAERPVAPPPSWPPRRGLDAAAGRGARGHRLPRLRWAAASLAVAAALAAVLLPRGRSPQPAAGATAPAPATAAVAAPADGAEVLVLWLDGETPLYLTLPAGSPAETEGSPR